MHQLTTGKILIVIFGIVTMASGRAKEVGNELDAVDGPNARVMRHEDGSLTLFTRSPDNRTLTKKKYNSKRILTMITIYRMDANRNPINCTISDGQNNKMFKVSYGYRKTDGLLVEERMFDARTRRLNPANGEEMPVQRVCYLYDAQGNRSSPIVYNLLPGKTFEQVFGVKSSALESNPFKDGAPR
ncbi:MAG: hypothetical protein H8M99_04325 [Gloeobacteraceae cyanobacterium ES-bin-144]|nr:hypothetical protein [Verrucomicrobiales bacterium]